MVQKMITAEQKFIKARDIRSRFNISNPTLHRWVEAGKFPKPMYFNGIRYWLRADIDELESRLFTPSTEVGNFQ